MKRYHALLVGTVLVLCSSVYAATIHVPADQPTIQAGINAAIDGDTVLVAAGIYSEALTVQDKNIALLSENGAEQTILTGIGRMIIQQSTGVVIDGFRFINASTIGVSTGDVTIRNCQFFLADNVIVGYDDATVRVYRCLFKNNLANPIVTTGPNCEFINNTVDASARGIAIYGPNAVIKNNIVTNIEWYGIWGPASSSEVDYNDFYQNSPNYGSGVSAGAHDISLDPQFVDTSANNYQILITSPCHDAGDPAPQYTDPDGTRNDMGAFPFSSEGVPYATAINYGPSASGSTVFTLTPMFYWSFFDTAATSQTGFEIEVGTDANWTVAEMWSSGSAMLPDTSVAYGGLPLSDLQEYYLRIRLHNGIAWGSWMTASFFTHIQKCIHVPSQRPTIQAGINAAVDGDTVLVAPGTYLESLSIQNKGITLLSSDGRTNTTLKPLLPATPLVAYTHCSSKVNVFKGFTLANVTNASTLYAESCFVRITSNRFTGGQHMGDWDDGTATLLWGNFIVKDNVFDSNQVGDQGGSIMLISQDSSLVQGNLFVANFAKHGAGIAVTGSNAVIRRNLFMSNTAMGYGGAIFLYYSSGCMVYNNTIDSCESLNGSGGGVGLYGSSNDAVFNNIMTYCTGYSIWQGASSGSYAAYNNCYAGTPANYSGITAGIGSISSDPQFVGGAPFDYHLKHTSPCIDAGNPDPAYNDPDGSRNDIGACPHSNRAPLSFALLIPANAASVGVSTLRPLFLWNPSVDPDTGDIVTYDFVIATDSNFSFVQQVFNLTATSYTLTADLQWGRQYWWNVKASDGNGGEIWSPQMFTFRTMTLGDADNDAIVSVADVVFLINYIFVGGGAPQPLMTGDLNCDGHINIVDAVYLINYVFAGGPAPCDSFPS